MWACPSEVADFDGVPIPGFLLTLSRCVFFLLGFGLVWFGLNGAKGMEEHSSHRKRNGGAGECVSPRSERVKGR